MQLNQKMPNVHNYKSKKKKRTITKLKAGVSIPDIKRLARRCEKNKYINL